MAGLLQHQHQFISLLFSCLWECCCCSLLCVSHYLTLSTPSLLWVFPHESFPNTVLAIATDCYSLENLEYVCIEKQKRKLQKKIIHFDDNAQKQKRIEKKFNSSTCLLILIISMQIFYFKYILLSLWASTKKLSSFFAFQLVPNRYLV